MFNFSNNGKFNVQEDDLFNGSNDRKITIDKNGPSKFLSKEEYKKIVDSVKNKLSYYSIPYDNFKSYEEYVKFYKDELDKFM